MERWHGWFVIYQLRYYSQQNIAGAFLKVVAGSISSIFHCVKTTKAPVPDADSGLRTVTWLVGLINGHGVKLFRQPRPPDLLVKPVLSSYLVACVKLGASGMYTPPPCLIQFAAQYGPLLSPGVLGSLTRTGGCSVDGGGWIKQGSGGQRQAWLPT